MKELKHIALFEKFESIKLSKILKYIKNIDSKNRFLKNISDISKSYDFPLSKLTDEYFSYLPFEESLKVYGKPSKSKFYCLKFWFDKNGNFITKTGVTGKENVEITITEKDIEKKYNTSPLSKRDRDVNTGDLVYAKLRSDTSKPTKVAGTIFKDRYSSLFLIHNNSDCLGSEPNATMDSWKKFGKYSWSLEGQDYEFICKLELKDESEINKDEVEEDPRKFNFEVGIDSDEIWIKNEHGDISNSLKDADFGIIFYIDDFLKSDLTKLSDIKTSRKNSRLGSTFLMDNNEIKKQNISRYISKLFDNPEYLKFSSGLNKKISKILGSKYCIFYISSNRNVRFIDDDFIGYILSFIRTGEERYINSLSRDLKEVYEENLMKNNITIENNISNLRRIIVDEREKEIFEEILKLSDLINKKILNSDGETIEDLEVIYHKILSIKRILQSGRYHTSELSTFMERIFRTYSNYGDLSYYMGNRYLNVDSTLIDIKRIYKIIEKL